MDVSEGHFKMKSPEDHQARKKQLGELTTNDKHIQNIDNTRMVQSLQDLNLSKSSNRHALFLVVHQDTLKSNRLASPCVNGLVHLAVMFTLELTLQGEYK